MHHFDQCLYGLRTIVETDHQPVEMIFKKPRRNAPKCLQRVLLAFQHYDLYVGYKRGSELFIVDILLRAYLAARSSDKFEEQFEHVHAIEEVYKISDETMQQMADYTTQD